MPAWITRLSALALGASLSLAAAAGPWDLPARVVDATGKTVGRLVTVPPSKSCALRAMPGATKLVCLLLWSDENADVTWSYPDSPEKFESTDCSGQAYYRSFSYPIPGGVQASYMGRTADNKPTVVFYDIGLLQTRTVRSHFEFNGTTRNCVANVPAETDSLYPVTQVIDLSTLFTLPFSVR